MTMAETICCTLVSCTCDGFKPGRLKRRQCEVCKHGWVAHALSKLKVHHMFQSSQVEIVHSNVVFDICSLMLYGTQAIPIRLKILLDRLFSVLKQEEVIQILNALDWTLQDYIRGYVLQDVAGKVLDRWAIMTFEEEIATLQQFLRFGETKSIVELMALQDKEGQAVLVPSTRTNSDIRTFIERNTPRAAGNLPSTKAEKLSGSSMHHFENFINSMAFMLPFQLLGSAPAPFLGTPTGSLQHQHQPHQQQLQACREGSKKQNERHEDDVQGSLERESLMSFSQTSERSVLCSTSVTFMDNADQRGEKPLSCSTKTEAEDFSTSDNYSDGPSTPCTPSRSSEATQMSPEGKLRSVDRSSSSSSLGAPAGGGLLKKGRVFCSACEKTFYDKGTLKIHYNAVHLKIKHKCTIEGCNMVFSSLRSRNRHSANPNPRLHMPMNRNNRDKDLRGSLSTDESSQGERRPEYGTPTSICSEESQKSVSSYMVSHMDSSSKIHSSSFPSMSHSGILFPNLKTVQPVLPFYRSLVTPAELANTPGTLPSLPLLSSSVPIKPAVASKPNFADPVPKKKSRKSSMPIKIEKDVVEQDELNIKENSSEGEAPSLTRDMEDYEGSQTMSQKCSRPVGAKEPREAPNGKDKEREESGNVFNQNLFREQAERKDQEEVARILGSPMQGRQLEDHSENNLLNPDPKILEERGSSVHQHAVNPADKTSELKDSESEFRATNRVPLVKREGSEECAENYCHSGLSHCDGEPDQMHHCEICSKVFKSPFSIKTHYQNVHLKEMYLCTVDGCNASFPSRRSRDRHSVNLNLHHKLLTKDSLTPASGPHPHSFHCDGRDSVGLEYSQDQRDRTLLHRDPTNQTSVIFRGHNRMGLVFPMSKETSTTDRSEPVSGGEGLGDSSGENAEEGTILDLSTSTSAPLRSGVSVRSSWDSDGAGSEEGEGAEENEEDPAYSDESCDGISSIRHRGEESAIGGERTPGCGGVGQNGLQGGVGGLPIRCHICQKVYSNKGTFRAHYKTVHLRLLHKCKVPGCDTAFSSVRSRNRHSQNPNLHRNIPVSPAASMKQE